MGFRLILLVGLMRLGEARDVLSWVAENLGMHLQLRGFPARQGVPIELGFRLLSENGFQFIP